MEKGMGLMEKDGTYIVAGVMIGWGKWYLPYLPYRAGYDTR